MLLRDVDAYEGGFLTQCALQLSPLLFVRPGEVRRAEWSEINLEAAEWRISAAKMKGRVMHIVPLAKHALAVLRELEPLSGLDGWILSGNRTNGEPMSENRSMPPKVWIAIGRKDWRPRFTFPPIHVVRFSDPMLGQGVEAQHIADIRGPVFGVAKIVADLFATAGPKAKHWPPKVYATRCADARQSSQRLRARRKPGVSDPVRSTTSWR